MIARTAAQYVDEVQASAGIRVDAAPRAIVRQAEDTHVAKLWRGALAHGATLIEANFPRAWIDPNRSLEDIDPALIRESDPRKLVPPLAGALIKNEQDVHLLERLAFMTRRRKE